MGQTLPNTLPSKRNNIKFQPFPKLNLVQGKQAHEAVLASQLSEKKVRLIFPKIIAVYLQKTNYFSLVSNKIWHFDYVKFFLELSFKRI